MSLNAGGLAQMTYNSQNAFGNGFGVPTSGFASRGKGSHIKHLSVGPSNHIHTIDENQAANPVPTPRTSRGHMLQGLRTAPKTPGLPPLSAPPTQLQQNIPGFGLNSHAQKENAPFSRGVPHTSVGSHFPKSQPDMYGSSQMYSLPEQILAPPAVQIEGEHDGNDVDPDLYSELVATNHYLAEEQRRLQQQLINVTNAATNAATQQLQGMNLHGTNRYTQSPMTPQHGYYQQQLQSGMQPVITAVPDQPGLYAVFNPMTGQQSFVFDQAALQAPPQANIQHLHTNQELSHSPPPLTPTYRTQVSPPPADTPSRMNSARSLSPPKVTATPPQEVNPLPPPSANAFRPSHKKAISFASGFGANTQSPSEGAKAAGMPKSAGYPQTPMTGTFGPGQGRAGEHPVRQPRGPPSLEELVSKPTSKFEGSKNFATRQRRRAVDNIVRARLTRGERGASSRASGSVDSLDSMTPASEKEITFSVSSSDDDDNHSFGSRSGSLSGKPSVGSLRAAASGAIGSERKKEIKELSSMSRSNVGSGSGTPTPPDRRFTADSIGSEEGLVEVKSVREGAESSGGRAKTPMLVLTSAEKRKSSVF